MGAAATEQHRVVLPSMTAWLIFPSTAFHLVELVPPVWALTALRRAFLHFLTLVPSTGRADRRKPSTFCGLLLDRKPVHFCRRPSPGRYSPKPQNNYRSFLLSQPQLPNKRPFSFLSPVPPFLFFL